MTVPYIPKYGNKFITGETAIQFKGDSTLPRQDKTRQDKTRQDKTRQDKTKHYAIAYNEICLTYK